MYQSAFMVEQEIRLRQEKVMQRQAEQRRLVREAEIRPRRQWPKLGDLYQFTFCAVRSIWRMAC